MSDPQTFTGGPGNDIFTIDDSLDQIVEQPNGGTDLANASVSYVLPANVENLTLTGTAALTGTGNELDNVITANSGNDTLNGMAGNDTLIAGSGTDALNGGDGNDLMIAGSGVTSFDGGAGVDTISFQNVATSVTVWLNGGGVNGFGAAGDTIANTENLIGSNFNDILHGDGGDNTLSGLAGKDQLDGGAGNDVLDGGAGDDFLLGGDGNDTLLGGDGNDVLLGGAGADIMTGGTGHDTFEGTAAQLNGDTITDLSAGDSILIDGATLSGFTYSISGNTLQFTGGSITLTTIPVGTITATAVAGGVQLAVVPHPHDDFNGDGKSDVLWRSDGGTVTDWLGQANGALAGNGNNLNVAISSNWHIAGTGDFNGDGKADVLWRADDGTVTDWLGQANGGLAGNGSNFNVNISSNWQVAGTGDFNGDGKADFLWRADDGTVTDWLGQANGGFTGNGSNFNVNISSNWHIAGTGDFNGDGLADILWRADDGTVTDWLGQSKGGFAGNGSNFNTNISSNWHIAGTGDFNGDGLTDILWRADDGTVTDWLGQSTGGFAGNGSSFNANISSDWHIVSIGDFNGDATDDILWRNDNGTVTQWIGHTDGTITGNGANVNIPISTDWHIQDPFVHDSLL